MRTVRPGIVQTTLYDSDVLGRLAAWHSGAIVLSSIRNPSYSAARSEEGEEVGWGADAWAMPATCADWVVPSTGVENGATPGADLTPSRDFLEVRLSEADPITGSAAIPH